MKRRTYPIATANYVPAHPPRVPARPVAAPTQGASVFVAVAVVLLTVLALLSVGIFGLIGRWQQWELQITALACLAGWGVAALLLLPWLIQRVIPTVDDLLDGPAAVGQWGDDD
jgi:hypothetical protein